jgi:hypothetical protein
VSGSTIHLDIDRLAITFTGAAAEGHRAGAISARAAELLAALVGRRLDDAGDPLAALRLGRLTVPPLEIDLSLTGNEEAAARVAEAVDHALTAKMTFG